MQQSRAKYQRHLFDETRAVPAVVRFPVNVQESLRQALVQWLQAVAKRMREEASDEQDHR
jgi:hypothetical protein